MQDAVIVTGVRTAVGRAKRGALKDFRPDEMLAIVISEAVKRTPNLNPEEIDDVIIGCAFPEGEQGLNVARIASLRAGLPVSVPAITINRFCSSGLQSIAFAAERIKLGYADIIIAGGVESMSMVPMTGNKFSANPYLAENYPEVYISMGLTAERVAEKYHITREMQDEFALKSHQKALKAIQEGKFKDEIVPLKVVNKYINGKGEKIVEEKIFDTDEGPRADTSLEKLAQLKPAFKEGGTVTAGNSSQMSDGAAVVVVMSDKKANELGLKPIARFVSYAVAGVPPEIMGIGPVEAIPKALKLAGLKLDDIGLIELNEAFAAQSLAVIKLAGLNEEIINVNGGAIALGHPLGCTGAKLTVTILNEMKRRNVKYGMVTMCIGGGMGAAGIFELI
ncbi:acetyl-CoA C-acyltransferase [Candidatus Kryptobacter tengchongensis]|uniref:acetyl-CoA C-acyltransferase n=1 Tax=Kryptobacter tengchongensis TaxID=1643429 RepID=UPI000708378D|nr:acetyl-CoA C-acyltransferase [Candidatus Kryptobacter tengchongensis]CUS80125.1 3-ketoacyl-CoA thiolase [Candidatus Kryptobacter tengchongensis]